VVINGRLYVFSNLTPEVKQESESCVKIIDLKLRRVFGVDMTRSKAENRPSSVRVNYSMALFKNKLYFYGGIDQDNKILDTIDEFDVTTYKFNHVKIRGDFKPKGRQAHAAIAVD